jgi:hypothetical protein
MEERMKKTLLVNWAIVLLALAGVLIGCEQLTEYTVTETIPSIGGPGNLKGVNDYEGVVTLTWDPVIDAEGYEVYRKTGDQPAVILGDGSKISNTGSFGYNDIVGANNVITQGTAYTYTVVAVSSHSTSRSIDVVQNGQSTIDITPAKIPAKASYPVPVVTGLSAVAAKNAYGNDVVRVTWNKNASPAVSYKVFVGGNDISSYSSIVFEGDKAVFEYDDSSSKNLSLGEKYKIEVLATFKEGYYSSTTPAASVIYTHVPAIAIGNSLTVELVKKYNTAGTIITGYDVSITWDAQDTVDSYALYVHKGSSSSTIYEWDSVPSTALVGGTTIALAPVAGKGFVRVTAPTELRTNYIYKLVAKKGTVEQILFGYLNEDPYSTSVSTPGLYFIGGIPTVSNKKVKVEVQVTNNLLYGGETLELYYAPTALYNSSNGPSATASQIIAQYTRVGSAISKTALEGSTLTARTVESVTLAAGSYELVAIVKSGTSAARVNYLNSSYYNPSVSFTVTN